MINIYYIFNKDTTYISLKIINKLYYINNSLVIELQNLSGL